MNLDALNDPAELLRKFIDEVAGVDWCRDKDHIRERLSDDLTDDLTEGDYEPYGVSKNCWFSEPARHLNHVEIIVNGFGLPSKAVLVLCDDRKWRLEAFWSQCTGCLGSGTILTAQCLSCGGTGWGLRGDPHVT